MDQDYEPRDEHAEIEPLFGGLRHHKAFADPGGCLEESEPARSRGDGGYRMPLVVLLIAAGLVLWLVL